jgi:hypothetical protein
MKMSATDRNLTTLFWGVFLAMGGCDTGGRAEPASSVETTESRLVAGECRTDADCRTFADYCTGCDCRALPVCAPDPVCKGPGVSCLINPCLDKKAVCQAGRCELAPLGPCPAAECGPPLALPNRICPDGKTVAGPTRRCLRQPHGGCGWEIAGCPRPCERAPLDR